MTVWHVVVDEKDGRKGKLRGPLFSASCALGRGGTVMEDSKREGDGATPLGTYPFRRIYYRPDREEKPISALPSLPLSAEFGWCDDLEDKNYNKLVRLPYGPSHEKMWRQDELYDLVLVLGHNDDPVIPGRGSAIFMHVAKPGFAPTEGCVALDRLRLRQFLSIIKPEDVLKIG